VVDFVDVDMGFGRVEMVMVMVMVMVVESELDEVGVEGEQEDRFVALGGAQSHYARY
jgi:hypothetical protein